MDWDLFFYWKSASRELGGN